MVMRIHVKRGDLGLICVAADLHGEAKKSDQIKLRERCGWDAGEQISI
jgi:hypothetical protein